MILQLNEILNSGLLAYGKEAYRNYSLYVQVPIYNIETRHE